MTNDTRRQLREAATTGLDGSPGDSLAAKALAAITALEAENAELRRELEKSEQFNRRKTERDNELWNAQLTALREQIAGLERDISTEQYRTNEQIRDKGRILREYEVQAENYRSQLAAARAGVEGMREALATRERQLRAALSAYGKRGHSTIVLYDSTGRIVDVVHTAPNGPDTASQAWCPLPELLPINSLARYAAKGTTE